MLISKLKKQLKKALIKAYVKYDKSFFLLESSLKLNLNSQKAIFSTNLIGSNLSQIALSFSLKNFSLKLPTVLKVFSNEQKCNFSQLFHNSNPSAHTSILMKKNNLFLKNKIHTTNPLGQKLVCVKLTLITFTFLLRMKSLNLLLLRKK